MADDRRQIVCKAYEEADKLAREAWKRIEKAHKKKDKEGIERAVEDFCKAMELVYKTWSDVVEELNIKADTSATENAFLAGYYKATRRYGLPDDLGVKLGDHVAARSLYRVSRILPFPKK